MPDPKWGERPLAAVVLRTPDRRVDTEMVRSFLSREFARFELPDAVAIIDRIPLTSTGKFDKKLLRQMHQNGELMPV